MKLAYAGPHKASEAPSHLKHTKSFIRARLD